MARPLVKPVTPTVPPSSVPVDLSAADTSTTPTCIAKAAKILATTIFFFPVLFFAISDTTT